MKQWVKDLIPYDIVIMDPCWWYPKRKAGKSFGNGVSNNYETMKTKELCALNMPAFFAKDCIAYIWCTSPHTKHLPTVMEAWDLDMKTKGFCWVKIAKNGKPISTTGNYTGANSEDCWVGARGKFIKPVRKLMNEIIEHPKMEHSRKPDEVQIRLDIMYPNLRKAELFARRQYHGWDCFGLELGHDFKDL